MFTVLDGDFQQFYREDGQVDAHVHIKKAGFLKSSYRFPQSYTGENDLARSGFFILASFLTLKNRFPNHD